jgi:hypothetical protein
MHSKVQYSRVRLIRHLSRTVTLLITYALGLLSAGAQVGSFVATGSLPSPGAAPTAVLLVNGKVLILSSPLDPDGTDIADLYDSNIGQFSSAGNLAFRRPGRAVTPLSDGRVLIVGGTTALVPAEIYDPQTGQFSLTGTPHLAAATATLLQDGRVLITGGGPAANQPTAELYDPAQGVFRPTAGSMLVPRGGHAAVLLPSGKVLLVGGFQTSFPFLGAGAQFGELFDPATETFDLAGTVVRMRIHPTATLLPDGTVFIVGLETSGAIPTHEAEIFDPTRSVNDSFIPGPQMDFRNGHRATRLQNGNVLISGGGIGALVYDNIKRVFSPLIPMIADRIDPAAALLPDGRVLVIGGRSLTGFDTLLSAEIFQPPISGCHAPVVLLRQSDPQWACNKYDNVDFTDPQCDPNIIGRHSQGTIRGLGCALTSLSMIMTTEGIQSINGGSQNPATLNDFLISTPGGYTNAHGVNFALATRQLGHSANLKFKSITTTSDMDAQLCLGHPVIVGVELDNKRRPQHFVVVTGKDESGYKIADPFFDRNSLSDPHYANNFVIRGYIADPPGDISGLNIAVGANRDSVNIDVSDSSGRRTGMIDDVVKSDIPSSSYTRDSLQDDESLEQLTGESHIIDLFALSADTYTFRVQGLTLGTFEVTVSAWDVNGILEDTTILSGIVGPASTTIFSIPFASSPGTISKVTRIATFESIVADIDNSLRLGLIDNAGIANSLKQKISAAQNSSGAARKDILSSFSNEVNAQSDKHIMGIAPQVLVDDAMSLIRQIP